VVQKQKLPFRADWERVVSFVIDFALSKRQGNGEKEIVDPQRIALISYSIVGIWHLELLHLKIELLHA
jgi:hypothetical protein